MLSCSEILDALERFHGRQEPCWPTDPYRFLVWWHSGYPASDAACGRGWDSLVKNIGVEPGQLLAAKPAKLTAALKPGGMIPESRGQRLKEIAARVKDGLAGDLTAALQGPAGQVRKLLKTFPGISDPGADRILLFAGIAPIAAVPSNCPQVLVRICHGEGRGSYAETYKEAQRAIESGVPATAVDRIRAYLLLKQHGQAICKRTKPLCAQCPLQPECAYASGHHRGATSDE